MALLNTKLREISVFIYTLIFLLIFNLYFNLNYSWGGVSLIVRIYLMVLSFYLVFIFASLDINTYFDEYSKKYGRKGKVILFIETRIIPFLFIYLITILFTLIDYIRDPGWPWNPVLSLLNGRYSNNMIYPWLLLIILKLKKKPSITTPLFLSIGLAYGILDKIISSSIDSGTCVSIIKILKLAIFFFFLISEFYNIKRTMVLSVILGMFIYFLNIASYSAIFKFGKSPYEIREAGLILLRMGYSFPLQKLKKESIKSADNNLIRKLLFYAHENNIEIDLSNREWEQLLFSGSVNLADTVSKYIINKDIDIACERIIQFAEKKSKNESGNIRKARNFIRLSSKYCVKHEKDLIEKIKGSNNNFKIWGIRILAENRSIQAIPLLLNFLTDIDKSVSDNAYLALKTITGMDPATSLGKNKNDIDTIIIFKKYYLKYSHNHKAD